MLSLRLHSKRSRNQGGFTLVELIAVIVILGVIGTVAAPKFVGLKTEAENKAATQAVAEGKNRLTNQYAIRLMNSEAGANDLAGIVAAVSTDAGDYKLSFAVAESVVEITATGVQERGVSGQANGNGKAVKLGGECLAPCGKALNQTRTAEPFYRRRFMQSIPVNELKVGMHVTILQQVLLGPVLVLGENEAIEL